MSLRLPLANQHFQYEKCQCNSKEIHKLFVVFFKHHRLQFLVLQFTQVINDRIQSEFIIASVDIGSFAGICDISPHLLIQFGNDNIAIFVLEQPTIHRDRLTLRRTHTDSIDLDTQIDSLFGRSYSIIFVVFTIRYDNNGATFLALGAETLDCSSYGIPDGSSLSRYRRSADGIQKHLSRDIIACNRNLNERRSRKNDETDTIILQFVRQPRNSQLGPFQPVRRIILSQHGIGYIQHHHDLSSFGTMFLEFGSQLRTGHTDDQEEEAQ